MAKLYGRRNVFNGTGTSNGRETCISTEGRRKNKVPAITRMPVATRKPATAALKKTRNFN
jgi:hypothetical protein